MKSPFERYHEAREIRNIRKILRNGQPVIEPSPKSSIWGKIGFALLITGLVILGSCRVCHAQELTASWYSVESLKQEGTWSYSNGRMANGHIFSDNGYTCATRIFPLGSILRVTSNTTGYSVRVRVTDRIGKRFAKTRIDLSKKSFEAIARLNQGLIKVNVEKI